MSWKKMLVAAAATMMVSSLGAANYYDQCCEPCPSDCGPDFCCDPCDGWSVYVDWLYWNVRRCDINYAVGYNASGADVGVPLVSGSLYDVCTDYSSGFRIGFMKDCGDIDFGIHYTRYTYDNTSKATNSDGNLAALLVSNPLLENLNGGIELAKAKYELDYDVVDVEVGYGLDMGSCASARVFGGFKYANICQTLKASYYDHLDIADLSLIDSVRTKVDMDAYGLYLGAEGSYTLCDCIDFFGTFSYGALIGDIDRHYRAEVDLDIDLTTEVLDVVRANISDDCWKFVSNLNLAVGVEYQLNNCFCADWLIAVGYEFHHYFCMSDFLLLETDGNEDDGYNFSTERNDNCLGFDGLFVRLGASF